jgi:prepilin-type processing-associated H-X9-DG protein
MSEQNAQAPPDRPRGRMSAWGWILIGCAGVSILLLAGVAILGAILFPVFAQARERARQAVCMSHLNQMSQALAMYSQDYDDRLPRRATWMDGLGPYTHQEAVFHCPSVRASGPAAYGYAFNSALASQKRSKLPQPASVRALYDSSNLARNAGDPGTSLPNPPRHLGNVIAYADGHVAVGRKQPGGP